MFQTLAMPEVTAPEAALLTGLNVETIRRYLRSGKLKSRMVGGRYLIDRRSLRPLIVKAGRPKGS